VLTLSNAIKLQHDDESEKLSLQGARQQIHRVYDK